MNSRLFWVWALAKIEDFANVCTLLFFFNGILLLFPLFLHAAEFQEYNNFILLLKQMIWIQNLVWERICEKLGPKGPKPLHSVVVIAESAADTTKKP